MKNKVLYTLIIVLFTVACSENILDVPNENSYDGSTFFTTATSYTEASTAMYTPLLFNGMYSREFYFIFDLLGNDAEKNFSLGGGLLEFPLYTFTPNNSELNYFWNSSYKIVFRTNFVLDLMEKWETSSEADSQLKQQITGEASFLKALAYFWLVTCYGDVPLKNSIADHAILECERTPAADIWASIETNLKNAIDNLPVSYSDDDYGRATRGAAVALLGKAYLFQKKYAEAIVEFNKLENAPYDYDLAESLDDIFIKDTKTKETVFAVMHGEWQGWGVGNPYYYFGGQEGWGDKITISGRAMEYGFNDWWNVLVSDALVESFHYTDLSGARYIDPRAALTFYSNEAQGGDVTWCDECDQGAQSYPDYVKEGQVSWRKYEFYEVVNSYGNPDSYINSQIIRYADVLLMLAEANIETGAVNNALTLINRVRARSGAFEYTTLGNQDQARTILRHERQMELAGEQTRFFDLVRWGTLVQTINAEKQAALSIQPVKDYHVLLPIPQGERDANPTLNTQVKNNWN